MKEKLDAIFVQYPAGHAVTFAQLKDILLALDKESASAENGADNPEVKAI